MLHDGKGIRPGLEITKEKDKEKSRGNTKSLPFFHTCE